MAMIADAAFQGMPDRSWRKAYRELVARYEEGAIVIFHGPPSIGR